MSDAWLYLPELRVFVLVLAGVLGLVMGSFLNCVSWRLVRGESWTSGRSHCDECGHELTTRDLVPVLSWVASRGHCRYCGAAISARNPATELLCAAVYVLLVAHFGPTAEALEMLGFASVLLVLSLTDLDDYIIPNGCIVAALVVRGLYLLWLAFTGADVVSLLMSRLIGAAVITGVLLLLVRIMDIVLGKDSMGFGDLKLFAVAALYFRWQEMLFLLIVACLLGIVSAPLARRLTASAGERPADVSEGGFPFGPSIALACLITALVGESFVSWYLSLLL